MGWGGQTQESKQSVLDSPQPAPPQAPTIWGQPAGLLWVLPGLGAFQSVIVGTNSILGFSRACAWAAAGLVWPGPLCLKPGGGEKVLGAR